MSSLKDRAHPLDRELRALSRRVHGERRSSGHPTRLTSAVWRCETKQSARIRWYWDLIGTRILESDIRKSGSCPPIRKIAAVAFNRFRHIRQKRIFRVYTTFESDRRNA